MRDTAKLSLTEVDIKPQNYNHKTSFTKITKVERFYSFLKRFFLWIGIIVCNIKQHGKILCEMIL